MFVRMEKRIKVRSDELALALTVWLRRMPRALRADLERYYLDAQHKRQGPKPDIEADVAAHIAAHFERANWEITYPEPTPLG